jgi:indole-3-glycerol phosphate synthase
MDGWMQVDMTTTSRMVDVARERGAIAPMGSDDNADGVLVLALSGVRNRADVVAYEKHGGVCGILVGEVRHRDVCFMYRFIHIIVRPLCLGVVFLTCYIL